jgi:hypothetical protein
MTGWTRVAGAIAAAVVLGTATSLLAEPVRLETAADVRAALLAGREVRVVLIYKSMSLVNEKGQPETSPDAIGGMSLDVFEYFAPGAVGNPEGYLAASHTQVIRHPRHGHVLNYVKLSLYDNGRVKIVAQYLSPTTYEVKMDETFTSRIATRDGAGAAHFFAAP